MNQIFGGEKIRDEILRILKDRKMAFAHLTHQETEPSKIAHEIAIKMNETIKSLMMRGKKSGKNYLVCLRGDQKVNMRALLAAIGEACEFEKIEILKERFGLEVGGVCPFGHLLGISDVFFDSGINQCTEVIFGCGLPNESIRMKLNDLIHIVHPKFVAIANLA